MIYEHSGDNLNNPGPSGLGCDPNPGAVVLPRVVVGGGVLGGAVNTCPTTRADRRAVLVALAGTMPDRDIADATGLAAFTVYRYRQENSIPPFAGNGGQSVKPPRHRSGSRVARWAAVHDVSFLPSTYADATHTRYRDALAACEAAVAAGELVKLPIDRRCPLQHYVIA